jgi:hypothetical protein
MRDERGEPRRLRFSGQERRHRLGEVQRLAAEPVRRTRAPRPVERHGAVDRLEHGLEPGRHVLAPGRTKGMPASRILRLARTSRCAIASGGTRKARAISRASSPRTHCSMSGVWTAASIAGCAQAKSSFSRSSGWRRDRVGQGHVGQILGGDGGDRRAGLAPVPVGQAVPRDGQEPAFGVGGHARRGPARERLREGVGQRVLGRDHVPRPRGEKGHEPPVGGPRHALGGRGGLGHGWRITGRISTWP